MLTKILESQFLGQFILLCILAIFCAVLGVLFANKDYKKISCLVAAFGLTILLIFFCAVNFNRSEIIAALVPISLLFTALIAVGIIISNKIIR